MLVKYEKQLLMSSVKELMLSHEAMKKSIKAEDFNQNRKKNSFTLDFYLIEKDKRFVDLHQVHLLTDDGLKFVTNFNFLLFFSVTFADRCVSSLANHVKLLHIFNIYT